RHTRWPRDWSSDVCSSDLSDAAPGPYDYLLVGLGACTSMTVGLYARAKKWPLENIVVSLRHSRIHATDCAECETKEGMLDRIDRSEERRVGKGRRCRRSKD